MQEYATYAFPAMGSWNGFFTVPRLTLHAVIPGAHARASRSSPMRLRAAVGTTASLVLVVVGASVGGTVVGASVGGTVVGASVGGTVLGRLVGGTVLSNPLSDELELENGQRSELPGWQT